MTTHSTTSRFDLSGFNYAGTKAIQVRRSAELARAEFIGARMTAMGHRIRNMYRSVGELFSFAQQQNQAARL
jgi:hypothetical protein